MGIIQDYYIKDTKAGEKSYIFPYDINMYL